MTDLLLHSMAELAEIVLPVLELAGAGEIVEVGTEHGTMTRLLIEHAARRGGRVIAIDPQPTPATRALFAGHAPTELREDLSGDADRRSEHPVEMASSSNRAVSTGTPPDAVPVPPVAANRSPAAAASWSPPALAGSDTDDRPCSDPGTATAWLAPDVETLIARKPPAPPAGGRDAEGPAQVYRRGYAEGLRDGKAEEAAILLPAVQALTEAGKALAAGRSRFVHNLEQDLYLLALAVARKIIHREVSTDPEIVRELVRHGLELVGPDTPVEIRLHPADLEAVRTDLEAVWDQSSAWRCTGDPAIERGGFFIESPRRIADGRLEEILRLIYERLAHE